MTLIRHRLEKRGKSMTLSKGNKISPAAPLKLTSAQHIISQKLKLFPTLQHIYIMNNTCLAFLQKCSSITERYCLNFHTHSCATPLPSASAKKNFSTQYLRFLCRLNKHAWKSNNTWMSGSNTGLIAGRLGLQLNFIF